MKILFLDHDGVMCLADNWGSRYRKASKAGIVKFTRDIDLEFRFDDFDKKAVNVLNEIIEETDCEIVVSSDWRKFCTLEEMGEVYESNGVIKKPFDFTPTELENPEEIEWTHSEFELEQTRALEIRQWLSKHPEVTNWLAVDDLALNGGSPWGLERFVLTPLQREGIKQSNVKEKIVNLLNGNT